MTREEAIRTLRKVKGEVVRGSYIDEVYDMAIEALKREQPDEWCTDCKEYDTEKKCCPRFNRVIRGALEREPSDDLISRAEAIEALVKETEAEGAYGYTDITSVVHVISNLPSADRPRGEWVEPISYEGLSASYYICSKCRCIYGQAFNYCPSCGAEMRGDTK